MLQLPENDKWSALCEGNNAVQQGLQLIQVLLRKMILLFCEGEEQQFLPAKFKLAHTIVFPCIFNIHFQYIKGDGFMHLALVQAIAVKMDFFMLQVHFNFID